MSLQQTSKNNGHSTLESMHQAFWYNKWTLQKFSKYLRGNILEIGCGIGNFTQSLTQYGKVWAFDSDPHCVTQTKDHVNTQTRVGFGNIETGKYFFEEKRFDSIVCLNVLEHVNNDSNAVKNIASLVKPGGHVIILVPIHKRLYGSIDASINHFRRYTEKEILELIKKHNLTTIFSKKINFFGAIGWFISGKILNRKTVSHNQITFFNTVAPFVLPIEEHISIPFGTSLLVIAKKR